MPPAARMMDMVLQTAPHCHAPIHPPGPVPTPVPHPALPLPILSPCAPTVLIGKMPAARVTDMTKICTLIPCVPAGPGIIAKGSATVLISKLPAARAGDMTSHPSCVAPIPSPVGNIIPPCCMTVMIGDAGAGGGGGGGGGAGGAGPLAATSASVDPATGEMTVTVGENMTIKGTPEFCAKTLEDLGQIATTPSGNKLLSDIDAGGHGITIVETSGGNKVTGFSPGGVKKADGTNGPGNSSTVHYNPDNTSIGSEPWQTRPPAVGLAHEMVHAQHAQEGSIDLSPTANDAKPDPADPTKTATAPTEEVRTAGIPPHDTEPYSENTIREEWDPPQPQRPHY